MKLLPIFVVFAAGLVPSAVADTTNLDTDKSRFPTLPEGFKINLFASEPLVRNPTCIAFDRRGRAFVAQGPQFRKPRKDTPGDSIRILIDHDDDGHEEGVDCDDNDPDASITPRGASGPSTCSCNSAASNPDAWSALDSRT